MCSWKVLLFFACAANLCLIVVSDDSSGASEDVSTSVNVDESVAVQDNSQGGDADDSDCGKAPKCGRNQIYEDCKNSGCVVRRCSELGYPLNCKPKCTPGCVCKDTHLRSDNGTCIPREQCPSCGGDTNAQPGCGHGCKNCNNYLRNLNFCAPSCILNGCTCKSGYYYDFNAKKCVLPTDCTLSCPNNEVYSSCINGGCDARNCTQLGKPVPCVKLDPKSCIKGCVCQIGYLRASNGTCVPKEQCPTSTKCPKPNEVYVTCIQPCPPRRCDIDDRLLFCPRSSKPGDANCKPGCQCADGYARNAKGICVLRSQCEKPEKCKLNEVFDYCPQTCPPKECGVDPALVLCAPSPKYGDPACNPGCTCVDGYVRNASNICIPKDKCPPSCPSNEVYSTCINGGCDARNCAQLGKPVPCVKLDPKSCIKGCVCQTGYLRAPNGTCVPKEQCPTSTKCPKPNEVYVTCIQPCPPRRCDIDDRLLFCPRSPKPGDPNCKPGCQCADGYARNAKGICVLRSQCEKPEKCKLNEVFDYCPQTCPPKECGVDPALVLCAPSPKYGDPACNPGCTCVDSYVRNASNICIPKDKCPPSCPSKEVYSTCINGGCDARNCAQLGKPVPCVKLDPKSCIKGCVCQTGYLRAPNGTCVPKEQCPIPPTCGPNEQLESCVSHCSNQTCNDVGKVYGCPAQLIKDCKYGCSCKPGFWRNKQNVCIPESECPSTCGPNEIYSSCANGGCDARDCTQVGKPVPCVDPRFCYKSCVCKKGYLRASNGECVPKEQCPQSKCLKPNEVYVPCVQPCPPRRCDVDDRLIRCKAPPKPGDPDCNPGCQCADGYARNAKGICVLRSQCDKPQECNNPNEVFDFCPQTCPPKQCGVDPALILCAPNPTYGDPACNPGCTCIDGYVRNASNICIPRDECPKCTGQNEYFDDCIQGCSNQSCDSIGKIFNCPIQTTVCKTGCRCNPGFYRNAENVCVPEDQCPQTCRFNEYVETCICGCSNQTCDDIGKIFNCPLQSAVCRTGCRCNPGFYRNATTPPCPDGEVYSRCPTVKCEGDYCPKTKDSPQTCPVGIVCDPPRCVCGFNRHRDRKTGKCIATVDCPPFPCGVNEEYQTCAGSCPGEKCSDYINNTTCPPFRIGIVVPCKPQCKCKKGYYRNDNGTCIIASKCAKCPKPNEVYVPCVQPCPPRRCDVDDRLIKCKAPPQPGDPDCNPGCQCADGYARNAKGICVLRSQCDKPECPKPNEVYVPCVQPCPPRRCDVDDRLIRCKAPPQPGDPDCNPGCQCADGYARNAKGICVLRSQCDKPKCTGQNEYFDDCIQGCSNQSCDSIGKIFHCPIQTTVCKTGCRCNPGFYRNAENVCVPEDQCRFVHEFPNISLILTTQTCRSNEFFDTCISCCSNQTCDDIGKIFNCSVQPGVCRTGCRCNPGFYRNASNVCVSESLCPTPPCPDGEVYSRCPTVKCEGDYCPKTKDSPQTCPVGIVCDPPRCVCGFNSHRDRKTGKCIATVDCPPFPCGVNEEFETCSGSCPGEKCSDYINNTTCPPFRIGIVVPCKLQCKCKKGYYRNDNGTCIIASKCGPKNTGSTSCPITPVPITTPSPKTTGDNTGNTATGLASLQAGIAKFTGQMLYDRMQASPNENIIISAFSVFTPLSQLCLYADRDSYNQLISVINLKNKDEIRSTFPAFTAFYAGQKDVTFNTAQNIYCNKNYPLKPEFKKDSKVVFDADAQNLDFSQTQAAADEINKWVANKTNDKIQDLVSADMFSELTRLVLVNAAYFKGTWLYEFNINDTNDADFRLSDGTTKKTKLMYQQATFNYAEDNDLDCQVLEMFYAGKNFSMTIWLPRKIDGVNTLADKLRNPSVVDRVQNSLRSQKVKVYIPPFEIKTTTDLGDILKKQGITDIFDETNSGLNGILEKDEPLYVSKAVQKGYIKVDETGSEAAAANAVVISTRSLPLPPPEPTVFKADHPFLCHLKFKSTIVFSVAVFNV